MYLKSKHDHEYECFINEWENLVKKGFSITDTHSHIHFQDYNSDFESMLARAKANGVKKIITIGINYEDSLKAQRLASQYRGIYFTAGIHPSEIEKLQELSIFEPIIVNKKCLAIGEIGLDFYRTTLKKDLQEKVFKGFLNIALYFKKPVIIHTREAASETLSILDEIVKDNNLRGVFHCFSGDENLIDWGMEHNFYFSFTGNVTFSKSCKLRSALKLIPIDRILLETDCPYLTPMPFRGKRNEPAYIIYTLYTAYKMKGLSLQEVANSLENNVNEFFNI
jgi:TatD DNase family protein